MEVKLKNVRLSMFNNSLFEKTAFDENSEKKYRATFLIDKEDKENIKKIKEAIKAVAAEKWGKKAEGILASIEHNPNKFCFRDGETKQNLDGYPGCMFISTSSKQKVLIIDRDRSELTIEDGKPYSGCYVNASVEIWAMKEGKNQGLHASLKGVQFYKDGDAFVGGKKAEVDDFDDLSEGADSDDEEEYEAPKKKSSYA